MGGAPSNAMGALPCILPGSPSTPQRGGSARPGEGQAEPAALGLPDFPSPPQAHAAYVASADVTPPGPGGGVVLAGDPQKAEELAEELAKQVSGTSACAQGRLHSWQGEAPQGQVSAVALRLRLSPHWGQSLSSSAWGRREPEQ